MKIKARLEKARHWLKTYIYASSRSKRGERRTLFLFAVMGLFLGIGLAVVIKEQERTEARQEELLKAAIPPAGPGEKRWLALEQLKLLLQR